MADAEELEALTDAAAAAPKTVSADGVTVVQQSVPELIALEKHRGEQRAASAGSIGIRLFKTKPPGAV